ncbi:MAG: alpha/beta hydrolase [Ilumatobacteraceae bacterium]|nr:alpha/beta hydrolase [Ilumatobacteraceae bacterium]
MTDPHTVVFVHGLWLAADSWQPWVERFSAAGYGTLVPTWPGESDTIEETRRTPERQAGNGVGAVTASFAAAIAHLPSKPIAIGHSFGGLVVQQLLAQGLVDAAVAISPAQMKGIKKLPPAQLKSGFPVLGKPGNRKKSVSLTKDQFAYGFGNALERSESDELYDSWNIPSPGRPLFQAAVANFQPKSEAAVDTSAARGPLLIIGAGKDHTVPASISESAFKRYAKATTDNEYRELPDRGHSLCLDHGWAGVADVAATWLTSKGR